MRNSIELRLVSLLVAILFLVVSVDYIPYALAWAPLILAYVYCCKSRRFRAWFTRIVNDSLGR